MLFYVFAVGKENNAMVNFSSRMSGTVQQEGLVLCRTERGVLSAGCHICLELRASGCACVAGLGHAAFEPTSRTELGLKMFCRFCTHCQKELELWSCNSGTKTSNSNLMTVTSA